MEDASCEVPKKPDFLLRNTVSRAKQRRNDDEGGTHRDFFAQTLLDRCFSNSARMPLEGHTIMLSLASLLRMFGCLFWCLGCALCGADHAADRKMDKEATKSLVESMTAWDFPFLLLDDDLEDTDSLSSVLQVEGQQHRSRRLLTNVTSCVDTLDFFGTRRTNGVNMLSEFYDCSCTGDLTSLYTFTCTLENYCFSPVYVNVTVPDDEVCINQNVSFEFPVADGMIQYPSTQQNCIDYLQGAGPQDGPLCFNAGNACAFRMKDFHGFSTEASVAICVNESVCPPTLASLNYTTTETRSLAGEKCESDVFSIDCPFRTYEILFYATIDCSDVDPCVEAYCQQVPLLYDSPGENFMVYPKCNGTRPAATTNSPTVSPTSSPTSSSTSSPTSSSTSSPTSSATSSPAAGSGSSTNTGNRESDGTTSDMQPSTTGVVTVIVLTLSCFILILW